MRTISSIKNIIISVALGALVIIVNFATQKFFINYLGVELLGLNGLFTNIITMLSVAELGFESAVVYHMYKPLHENKKSEISSLMHFYKISYRVIAVIIATSALILIPFIPTIAGNPDIPSNIYIIYGLFVTNSVVSYLLSYKRSILYADQKSYIVNIIRMSSLILFNIFKITALITTKNYYIFLILTILMTLAENIVISWVVNKKYQLDTKPKQLSKKVKKDIFKKIQGLLFHKIGSFAVKGTDNIIISMTLGLGTLGLYTNYQLIQSALQSMFGQIASAIRASIGNLLVDIGGEKSYKTFLRLQLANQILAIISISVFFVASDSLISVWLGKKYILDLWVLIALSISLYTFLIRLVFGNFKEAAGIFYEDRFVPIMESVINITTSFLLVNIIGLAGVFIGTAISSLSLHCYSYPKYVYKGVFHRSYREYTSHILGNFFIAIISIVPAFYISRAVVLSNSWAQLMYDVAIAIIIPLLIVWSIYRKSDEYRYFKKLFAKLFKKLLKRHA